MKHVLPTPEVQACIQALNAACRRAYGAEAYLSLGDGNMGAIVVGNRAEVIDLANGMQQNQFQNMQQQQAHLLRPAPVHQLRPVARQMLVARVI